MSGNRREEIRHHLSKGELQQKLAEADDEKIICRLSFIKNLYAGDIFEEAADRVGMSQLTGSRWSERWNDKEIEGLAPSFGDRHPPKLDEAEQQRLIEILEAGQSGEIQEIRQVLLGKFDIKYHLYYIIVFLRSFGMHYTMVSMSRIIRSSNGEL